MKMTLPVGMAAALVALPVFAAEPKPTTRAEQSFLNEAARGGRVADCDLAPVPIELACSWLESAIDDLDQRGFAGAILAQERMNLAWRNARHQRSRRDTERPNLGCYRRPERQLQLHPGRHLQQWRIL